MMSADRESHPPATPADRPPPAVDIDDRHERFIPDCAGHELMHAEHAARYRYACRVAADCQVLDLACGVGFGSRMLASEGAARSVVGVDLSEAALRYANIHHGAANVAYVAGDALRLPFEAETFDLVVMFEFIEHVAAQVEAIAEAARVLKPGGRLLVSTPNRVQSVGRNPFHIRELSESEFRAMLGGKFRFVELVYQCNVLASYVTPLITQPGQRDIHHGFTSVIGNPFRTEEALFMVAMCSNEPLSEPLLRFDGGACLSRNDEYQNLRNALEERARAISQQTQRILDCERQIREQHSALRALQAGQAAVSGRGADAAFAGSPTSPDVLGILTRRVEELVRELAHRDEELTRLRSEFAAGVRTIEQRTNEMQAALESGLARLDAAHRNGARAKLQAITDALNSIRS